ncbi:unnamed protein product [Aphanomyces euteiches]|uniref:Uncharacterized protein n=1 Tax=Aphanomyces euteiches TaxID=100861 RepID=A0A6G0XNX1_9STRA|nr:hypothetical protein Ae201684_002837 [Aphanomyces euteiches]KAG9416966.1 hypothetical protein AC1031_001354 [Aphanomyces cochlioides]KAH9093217.1 hypothetical protein Ae201684P_008876 [Aphanomyces euteiches]KAH9127554.1 hypothetical protein AeMF1_002159 [Aphanomyces euteiches]KAH9146183.1 hypothetical protein AeRB84_009924 [Aphanomyces euteiches]
MLGRLNQATRAIKPVGQARMAHHGPPPTYTGLEAQIRAKLPNDHDIVLATLGFYTVITAPLWFPSGKKPAKEEAAPAANANASTVIPSLFDDNFDEWSKVPGNFAKWEASLDKIDGN